jgi:hypothetical protein
MQKLSRFALLFSGLFAVAVVVARIILGGWHEAMWVPLGLSVFFFFFGVFTNWRMMLDFFMLKTTKHGMNMGVLILTFLVLLVVVNFLAVSQDKKWDFTSEGLNSLSEQSIKAVQSLTAARARGETAKGRADYRGRSDASSAQTFERETQEHLLYSRSW